MTADDDDPSSAAGATSATTRGRILVVDDESVVARMTERILKSMHDVTVVANGAEALVLFQSGESFDVVLCDLMMPQMTGMELYDAVSALDRAQASRFVFVTGGAFTPWARRFLASIANPCIEKPFDTRVLRATVDEVMRAR